MKSRLSWFITLGVCVSLLLAGLPAAYAQAVPTHIQITQADITGDSYPQVKLTVSVTDNTGQPVSGLEAGAFSVTENQAPITNLQVQPIQSPLAIGFVIDSSKNLERKEGNLTLVEHAKQVIGDWVDPAKGHLQTTDMLALSAFKDGAPQMTEFKNDVNYFLDNDLAPVSTAGNVKTALFDLVSKSVDAAAAQPAGAKRALVIFSDGIDSTSSLDVDKIIEKAKQADLTIYTIGMSSNLPLAPDQEGSKFLRRLALETGGEYFWYRPVQDKEARVKLDEALTRMTNQRNLYQLTYDTAQCSGDPSVRIVLRGTSVETTANYPIPQHQPSITLEGITPGAEYIGTPQTVKVGVKCIQSPLTKVEFKVDNQIESTDTTDSFEYNWDTNATAQRLGVMTGALQKVKVTAKAYAGPYTAEASQNVLIGPLPPPPTPEKEVIIKMAEGLCMSGNSFENFVCKLRQGDILSYVTIAGFVIALVAVILLIVLIRRGGIRAVGQFAGDSVRRVTKTFQRKTGIKGAGGAMVRPVGLATLILESEPYGGKRIYIEEPNVYVGRVPEKADIVFEWDDYVSGRHAKIQQTQGRFFLWDLQSANGSWVDDQRVPKSMSEGVDYNEARELVDGSVIRFGPDLRLRFRIGTEVDASAAKPLDVDQTIIASSPVAAPYRASSTQVMPASSGTKAGEAPTNDPQA